jgi:RES domain-containing protein
MKDRNWPQLIITAPAVPFEGRLVRCIPQLTYAKGDPPSYLFTSGLANRCNPKGVSCIYMGEDRDTADCEYQSYNEDPEPQVIYTAEFKARAILDLGDKATRKHFGLTDADFFKSFRLATQMPPLQALGEAVSQQKKIVAIRFPSNACHKEKRSGFNMAIFPDALEAPDYLGILGRKGATLEKWP